MRSPGRASGALSASALIGRQVIRHKLVDMQTRVEAARALLEDLAWRVQQGERPVAQLAMLKNFATGVRWACREGGRMGGAEEAGEGRRCSSAPTRQCKSSAAPAIMRGTRHGAHLPRSEGDDDMGGSEEIMKDLAARQLGW